MKTLRTNAVIIFAMIIIFDVAMYVFLPDRYALRFNGYRQGSLSGSSETNVARSLGRHRPPQYYYVRNECRGFDIRANQQGHHRIIDGLSYPVWSNSIGCFDREHARYERYVYIAGDSTAWGYAPFEQKFGTLLEQATGKQILKCGVTHTGQRHQFEKMVEIIESIGVMPETILVIYSSNDVFNDYGHPHGTVVSGWLVDSAKLDSDNQVHRYSHHELEEQLEAQLRTLGDQVPADGWSYFPRAAIRRFSLTAHLAQYLIRRATPKAFANSLSSEAVSEPAYRNLNRLPQEMDGRQWYLDNPYARENKEALLAFKRYAEKNDIRLIVVLMPLKWAAAEGEKYYEQTRLFLESNGIEFIDPAFSLIHSGTPWSSLFWEIDVHPNPVGNKVIADILLREAPGVFQ